MLILVVVYETSLYNFKKMTALLTCIVQTTGTLFYETQISFTIYIRSIYSEQKRKKTQNVYIF